MTAARLVGEEVAIGIDRPLGSSHPCLGFVYPVNDGCLPGEVALDGEYLGAYVLGIFGPLDQFTGRCIAVIHRLDDQGNKLVVPNGICYSDDQIPALTEFQERFFRIEVLR